MLSGPITLWMVFVSEIVGTTVLVLLGCGVIANVHLRRTAGSNGGWLLISIGWSLAVYAGIVVAYDSGAHLNPAVTLGVMASGQTEFVRGSIPVDALSTTVYLGGQLIGAALGALLVWAVYRAHFDETEDAELIRGVFVTIPRVRGSIVGPVLAEFIGTFLLVFAVLALPRSGDATGLAGLGGLPIALVILGIVVSLGGPTGAALNPARDIAPRIIHAIVPIRAKGTSDWSYAWVPVVAPALGGIAAGASAPLLLPIIG